MVARENKSVPIALKALLMLFFSCCYLHAQATVRGNVEDLSKPVEALVNLEQLTDASCVGLYTGKFKPAEAGKKAKSCQGSIQQVNTTGSYEFQTLRPGWYILRFQWVMSQPPDSRKPVGCSVRGWSVSYVPWKESGKYKGFAQSPPFELHEGEQMSVDFNYDGEFKIQKDCPKPLKWKKR